MKITVSIIMLSLAPLWAWCHTINGKVVDEENHPIEGVLIYSPKTEKHAHTNYQGMFVLDGVDRGDTLTISHVAYISQSFVVSDASDVTIVLEEKTIELSAMTVRPQLDALNMFTQIDLNTTPVNSSQEILRKVPGLFIGQHAGGGKAEQLFLRGFDLDHGTDIAISVDGMPVNMVSHAHGQGYADLHFLIPETIEKIDFGKGPYNTDQGNLATAAYVAFKTKDRLDQSLIQTEYGQFNTMRILGMTNILNNQHQSAYVASEYLTTDGPFDSPQNFSRVNIMGKYTGELSNGNILSAAISHFTSTWDASGQIPQRAVDEGIISRFGAIDSTEGGQTSRTNINLSYTNYLSEKSFLESRIYWSHYEFELYSDFTFYLNDPENGDQIRQKEGRNLFGINTEWNHFTNWAGGDLAIKIGVGLRDDQTSNTELSHTVNRQTTLDTLKLGDIHETNSYAYANIEWRKAKWVVSSGLRADYFRFGYYDRLLPYYETQAEQKAVWSPKLNFLYNQSDRLQYYLKSGIGFHSNDTRVVVSEDGHKILPKAYGSDLGLIWKPVPEILINTAIWTLYMEQEFVYVGDEGVVEPSGKTSRSGLDFGFRWQLYKWLYLNADLNYTHARALSADAGEDYIPLAANFTSVGGLSISGLGNWHGGIQYRYMGDRPANEDNSIVATGYTIFDGNVHYQFEHVDIGVNIQNLFNVSWNETQFATESRLAWETSSVEEIHFTPGTPFFIKGVVRFKL